MKILSFFLWAGVIVGGVLFLFWLALYFLQGRLVFYPTRDFAVTPSQLGITYEEVSLPVTPGEQVHGWYFPARGEEKNVSPPVVLFCHGNAGNISHRLETAEYLLALGVSVLLFDYRGYGKSGGSPSEENLYADAKAAYEWLVREKGFRAEDIVLFGRSLGGAVAIEVARQMPCRGLVVESSFTSAEEMAKKMFPFVPGLKYGLRYSFHSLQKIPAVSCPVLVTHSPDDEIVPYEMGKRLYEAAPEPKRFVRLQGGHNEREYFRDESYREALRALFFGTLTAE